MSWVSRMLNRGSEAEAGDATALEQPSQNGSAQAPTRVVQRETKAATSTTSRTGTRKAPLSSPFAEIDTSNPTPQEAATYDARDSYWDKIGVSDADLISYAVNPQFLGAPAWPNTRQAYRLVRTGDSLIIASDGLCDPFPESMGKGENNGLGMEVFIEIPGWQERTLEQVHNSWAFSAVELFAQNTAGAGGFLSQIEKHGVMSMELPLERAPKGWVAQSGNVGALIDVPVAPGLNLIHELPGGEPARLVPLTLIQPRELTACVKGGAKERRALAQDLVAAGNGHRTVIKRACLRN